jgi:hypothetical protein
MLVDGLNPKRPEGSKEISCLRGIQRRTDTETVLRNVCARAGSALRRIPDGETGPRRIWKGLLCARLRQAISQRSFINFGRGHRPFIGLDKIDRSGNLVVCNPPLAEFNQLVRLQGAA